MKCIHIVINTIKWVICQTFLSACYPKEIKESNYKDTHLSRKCFLLIDWFIDMSRRSPELWWICFCSNKTADSEGFVLISQVTTLNFILLITLKEIFEVHVSKAEASRGSKFSITLMLLFISVIHYIQGLSSKLLALVRSKHTTKMVSKTHTNVSTFDLVWPSK